MRFLLAVLLLPLLAPAQDEIPYLPESNAQASYTAALKTAKAQKKHLWIQIGEPACPACKRLYLFMAAHPGIAEPLDQHFIPLHLAISRENIPLFRAWNSPQLKHGLPVILVLNADGQVLTTSPSSAFSASVGEFSEIQIIQFLRRWAPQSPTESGKAKK